MLTGIKDLPCQWIVQLCIISQGNGRLGAIGVDCSSSKSISGDVLASLTVLTAVFSCHSMNPFKLWACGTRWYGQCTVFGENLSNSSAVKGGPLSVYRTLGGSYWDITSWNYWTWAWADFKVMQNRKGNLWIGWLWASNLCHYGWNNLLLFPATGCWGCLWGHWLRRQRGLVLGPDGTSLDIVSMSESMPGQ